jgi:biopolymer transport protein ExbB/TolQ
MESVIQAADSNSSDVRVRRTWKIFLAAGIVLAMGPSLGLLGTLFGMAASLNRIETLKAPTPDDLGVGVHISLVATTLGLVAGAIGVPLVVLSCVKLAKFWNEPTSASSAT